VLYPKKGGHFALAGLVGALPIPFIVAFLSLFRLPRAILLASISSLNSWADAAALPVPKGDSWEYDLVSFLLDDDDAWEQHPSRLRAE